MVETEILDNSQPGFWSSSSTTWTTSSQGLDGSSLVSSTANGSKQSQAAWWFSMPAGVYEIDMTYTAGSNLTKKLGLDLYDGVGNWIGQIAGQRAGRPQRFHRPTASAGNGWEAFKLTSNIFHISTWNSPTDGAIAINAIRLRAAPMINDSATPRSSEPMALLPAPAVSPRPAPGRPARKGFRRQPNQHQHGRQRRKHRHLDHARHAGQLRS